MGTIGKFTALLDVWVLKSFHFQGALPPDWAFPDHWLCFWIPGAQLLDNNIGSRFRVRHTAGFEAHTSFICWRRHWCAVQGQTIEDAGTHKSAKTHVEENPAASGSWKMTRGKPAVSLALIVPWVIKAGKTQRSLRTQQQRQGPEVIV